MKFDEDLKKKITKQKWDWDISEDMEIWGYGDIGIWGYNLPKIISALHNIFHEIIPFCHICMKLNSFL